MKIPVTGCNILRKIRHYKENKKKVCKERGEPMELTKELLERAKRGETSAFSELYRNIYRDLYRFALYTLQNPQDAEDAVSEAVVDAWQGIRNLRKTEAFKSWIFRILVCKCKQKLREYVDKTEELPEGLWIEKGDLCQQMDVRKAFEELEEEERMILALNIFAGYTSKEIGKELQMRPGTVRSKQSRALKKMEAKLSK